MMLDWNSDDVIKNSVRTDGVTNCPNCGYPIQSEKCEYCGTVFIDFAAMDADKPFFMKIKSNGKVYIVKVMLTSATMHSDTTELCTDSFRYPRYTSFMTSTELTMDFVVVP